MRLVCVSFSLVSVSEFVSCWFVSASVTLWSSSLMQKYGSVCFSCPEISFACVYRDGLNWNMTNYAVWQVKQRRLVTQKKTRFCSFLTGVITLCCRYVSLAIFCVSRVVLVCGLMLSLFLLQVGHKKQLGLWSDASRVVFDSILVTQ